MDLKEPDCASTGPYFDENECEIGKKTTFKTIHCICSGDPGVPMLLQSTFFDHGHEIKMYLFILNLNLRRLWVQNVFQI